MKHTLFSLCIALASSAMAELAIVQNGAPMADIVCPKDAHPAVAYAAAELRDHIRMITGAELPVVPQPASRNAIVLSVGDKQFADDLKAIGETDGYAVRQKGSQVFVLAAIPKGVLNGVYKLLFNNTDIIWARPDEEIGTLYTETKNLTLTRTDWLDVPKFILRGWQFPSPRAGGLPSDIWQFRQGSNWSASHMHADPKIERYGTIKEYGGGHNLCGVYISERKYYDKHPEFYSLVKGKRSRHSELRGGTQLCFTNAEMTKCFMQEVDARCKANPGYATYRIMIEDNYHLCECDECTKPITLPDGTVVEKDNPAFRSTQFFLWLNPIARHIREAYGKRVLTFAYFFTEIPPLCPVEPNIDISLCPIYKNSKFNVLAPENKRTFAKADGWLKVTPNVTWREYYGLCAAFPRPIDAVAIDDYRYVNSRGVVRTYSEMRGDCGTSPVTGRFSWDVNSMYFWVIANATWNPTPDVKDFRRTFLTRVYKQAADDVERFYAIIEKDFIAAGGNSGWNDNPFRSYRDSIVAQHHIKDCQDALASALAKGLTGRNLKMLERLTSTFQTMVDETNIVNAYPFFKAKKPLVQTAEAFDSPAWRNAVTVQNFIKADGKPARAKTAVKAYYDDDNVYLGVRAYAADSAKLDYNRKAGALKAGGESFQITAISMADMVTQTQFTVDPAGNRSAKPAKWSAKTEILPDGWFAFISIPWQTLRDNVKDGFRAVLTRTHKMQDAPAEISFVGSPTKLPLRLYTEKSMRKYLNFGASAADCQAFDAGQFKAPKGKRNNVTYNSFRWCSEVLLWGDKDEKASFTLRYDKVNNTAAASAPHTDTIVLLAPDGKEIPIGEFVFDGKNANSRKFAFAFPKKGLYRLCLDPGFNAYYFSPAPQLRWSMRGADKHANSLLIRPTVNTITGCFQVPKGVTQFTMDIGGGSGANDDPGTLVVKNAKGEVVCQKLIFEPMQTITFSRDNTDDEIWTIEAVKPKYAFHIRMPNPLANIWANSPGNLPRLK